MKKLSIICIFTVLLVCIQTSVMASSINLETKADNTTLKSGETITINLEISDIDAGTLGVNVLEGVIKYDENIFETITEENFQGENGWIIKYNPENGRFMAYVVSSGITETTNIGNVKFKVKTGVEIASSTISIENISSNDGTNIINVDNKKIDVSIVKDAEIIVVTNTTNIVKNTVQDTTVADKYIPKAGKVKEILFGCFMIIALAISAKIYIKYRNVGKTNKN